MTEPKPPPRGLMLTGCVLMALAFMLSVGTENWSAACGWLAATVFAVYAASFEWR